MKELTIGQKAKAYDEAKEKAKVLKECSTNTEVVRYMDELFPELAESEDEKIRNYILSHLQQHLKTVREFLNNGMSAPFSSWEIKMLEASVVWLEKQGEQKSVVDTKVIIPKLIVEQKPVEWHREDEQNLNACLGYIRDEFLRRWLMDVIHAKYDKPADMVESKFKVGE